MSMVAAKAVGLVLGLGSAKGVLWAWSMAAAKDAGLALESEKLRAWRKVLKMERRLGSAEAKKSAAQKGDTRAVYLAKGLARMKVTWLGARTGGDSAHCLEHA
jgi:hypothetical protein